MENKIHLEEIRDEIKWILCFCWDLTLEERAGWEKELAQLNSMLIELKGGARI